MKSVVRKTAIAVLSAAAIMATAPGAMAENTGALANPTKTCKNPDGFPLSCALSIPNFGGGTIALDVDADGGGTGHWILLQHGAWRVCETTYNLKDPAQSWLCHGLPADNYVLINYGQSNTTFHRLGARY
ncbi:hypothetical protein ACWEPC_37790 [Nonomuraea sp. NPDC004297]